MDGTCSLRARGNQNTDLPNALPAMGVESEEEGKLLLVLACVRGYGPFEGRYVLSGFYDPDLPTHKQVNRIWEAEKYLTDLQTWTNTPHPRGTPPQNPWT